LIPVGEPPGKSLKIGCCGSSLSKTEYARLFPVVEVQQTFYQPPLPATLQRWRAETPPDFEFTLKAWQLITHAARSPTYRRLKTKLTDKELAECGSFQSTPMVRRAWQTTLACAKALEARHMVFQCPASFSPTPGNLTQMRGFFSSADRGGLRFLWEPRGDWEPALIKSLCDELELVHVVDPFVARTVTPDFIYFRLHGGKGFRHVYSEAELQALAEMIPRGNPAYVMFNNIERLKDAGRFSNWVESSTLGH
jgi:uncharacterized protein YecE (DUF72 family)